MRMQHLSIRLQHNIRSSFFNNINFIDIKHVINNVKDSMEKIKKVYFSLNVSSDVGVKFILGEGTGGEFEA